MLSSRSPRRHRHPAVLQRDRLIVEEAREPPPVGPWKAAGAERERRTRTYRVRDHARGPERRSNVRERTGSLDLRRNDPIAGRFVRSVSTLAIAAPPRYERRELT
jgi:hypothetical protein